MSHANSTEEVLREENQRFFTFVNLALILAVLTGIEIVIIFIPVPSWVIMSVLVGLSVVKFICVILWFMHLIYDKLLCTLFFLSGLILAVGTMIALMLLFSPAEVDEESLETGSLSATPAKWINA